MMGNLHKHRLSGTLQSIYSLLHPKAWYRFLETTFTIVIYLSDHQVTLVVSFDEDHDCVLENMGRIVKEPETQELGNCIDGGYKGHRVWELEGNTLGP